MQFFKKKLFLVHIFDSGILKIISITFSQFQLCNLNGIKSVSKIQKYTTYQKYSNFSCNTCTLIISCLNNLPGMNQFISKSHFSSLFITWFSFSGSHTIFTKRCPGKTGKATQTQTQVYKHTRSTYRYTEREKDHLAGLYTDRMWYLVYTYMQYQWRRYFIYLRASAFEQRMQDEKKEKEYRERTPAGPTSSLPIFFSLKSFTIQCISVYPLSDLRL